MADEHHGETKPGAQLLQQQQNVRLGRDIEARHDFVGHDEVRLECERPRDAGALTLPARKFVRIPVGEFGGQADKIEQSRGTLALVPRPLQPAKRTQGARQRGAQPQARIERRLRILKNHLDARTQRAHFRVIKPTNLDTIELNAAGGRFEQPNQQSAKRRLAGTGFAGKAEHRSAGHGEIDAFDHLSHAGSAKRAVAVRIAEMERAGADQNVVHAGLAAFSESSLRASNHNCSTSAGGTGRNVSAGRSARGVAARSARV